MNESSLHLVSGYPESCDTCLSEHVNAGLFDGDIELDVVPVKGTKPQVMIIGQDPTIYKRKVHSVLDLENTNGVLYRYIVAEILKPAGLSLDSIYATNLIKCRFPLTPKRIAQERRISMTYILKPFADRCQEWLQKEIQAIQPKIVMSFGQPVHKLLIHQYHWDVPKKMKYAFGNTYFVQLNGCGFQYVPCIHINSRGHQHYNNLWNDFIGNFRKTVSSSQINKDV